jgi:predicted Fe-S protein YdhL (DUF1289 family)
MTSERYDVVHEGVARAAHQIDRAIRLAAGCEESVGPAWHAMTTKERNAVLARCQRTHDALRQQKTARDAGEEPAWFEIVRHLLPAFQAVEHARKHVELVAKASEDEQLGALLYIAAIVSKVGGEIALTRDELEAAVDCELMRHDGDGDGLVLRTEPKEITILTPPEIEIASH